MKTFIKKHKRTCIIGGIFLLLLLIFFIIFFIMPLFKTNSYGDRLEGIEDYPVTDKMVNEVTSALEENENVQDVSYNNEGRILNFIITINPEMTLDDAKALANVVTDNLNKKTKNYYDIEVYLTTEEDSDIYPVIGYHAKEAKEFSFSNVGDTSE